MPKLLKLTVKTLDYENFALQMEEDERVGDLKNVLYEIYKLPILPQKQYLIYGGRVLFDGDALSEYDIDERKFLVVMNKPKRKSDKSSQSENDEPTKERNVVEVFPNLNKWAEREILKYSFVRADVKVSIMRNNRSFQEAFREAHTHPERIGSILHRISREDPNLFKYLQNNLDEMLFLIGLQRKDVPSCIVKDFLTREERLAVKRLTEFGFNLTELLKVYFKFDRDEQMTADYLFKKMEEDNSQP